MPGTEHSPRDLLRRRLECYCFDGVTRLGLIRGTMRKNVHPLERSETLLKQKPDRPQFSKHGKYGKLGSCAIRQAPICMLAGEPYDDPRDFTLDLKKQEPEHNVTDIPYSSKAIRKGETRPKASEFDRYSGLSTKHSLLPSLPITKPLRGEVLGPQGAESRRRILGMGGAIEPVRPEERSNFVFGGKMSS